MSTRWVWDSRTATAAGSSRSRLTVDEVVTNQHVECIAAGREAARQNDGLGKRGAPHIITSSGEDAAERSVLCRLTRLFGETAVHRIDLSDDRRTAEGVLAIESDEIRDVLA